MLRRLLPFAAVALLCSGCVDVTEPVGDITTAKPNDKLIGEWTTGEADKKWVIDRPDVKGNPKGLMRLQLYTKDFKLDKDNEPLWFFTTEVDKRTYANHLVTDKGEVKNADFSKEGEYEKWAKQKTRRYTIARISFDRDTFSLHIGKERVFAALMKENKIDPDDGYYKVPAGWLATYLEKNGPDAIFDKDSPTKLTRVKK